MTWKDVLPIAYIVAMVVLLFGGLALFVCNLMYGWPMMDWVGGAMAGLGIMLFANGPTAMEVLGE